MSVAGNPSNFGWRPIAGGGWLFDGKRFADERGDSFEICDLSAAPSVALSKFTLAQENLVGTEKAGCARGLHYQNGKFAQAKIVTVLRGSAQLFWLPFDQSAIVAEVHSIILRTPDQSLYTPDNCAHGIMALEDDTFFLLKTSSPTVVAERREINLLSDRLSVSFARPVRLDLRSERDRNARHWSPQAQDS